MPAMALLDRNGVYGAQRFSVAAREHNLPLMENMQLHLHGSLESDGPAMTLAVERRF